MDEHVHAAWIEALKSGRYQQTDRPMLVWDGRFDPLGVLRFICDSTDRRMFADRDSDGNIESTSLEVDQLREYGLTHADAMSIYELHDDGNSFGAIAQWIYDNVAVGRVVDCAEKWSMVPTSLTPKQQVDQYALTVEFQQLTPKQQAEMYALAAETQPPTNQLTREQMHALIATGVIGSAELDLDLTESAAVGTTVGEQHSRSAVGQFITAWRARKC